MDSEKIKKLFRRRNPFTRLRDKIKKIKSKKNFSRQQPPPSTCGKGGGGVRVENVGGIYSVGKYHVLAICVRTQIDVYLKGGITAHSDNKTCLKQSIFVHNGRYTRKQDGTRLKMNKYTQYCIYMHKQCIFMQNNTTFTHTY